jgi:hypothetical protein
VESTNANDFRNEEIAWGSVRWVRLGPVPAAGGFVIDDPGFEGPLPRHLTDTGYGGDAWVSVAVGSGRDATKMSWALPALMPGTYRIDAYMEGGHTEANATYTVPTATGPVSTTVFQAVLGEQWVSLGTFRMTGSAAVMATTLSRDIGKELAWDAIRVTPISLK